MEGVENVNRLGEMFMNGMGAGMWLVGAAVAIVAAVIVVAAVCSLIALATGAGKDDDGP